LLFWGLTFCRGRCPAAALVAGDTETFGRRRGDNLPPVVAVRIFAAYGVGATVPVARCLLRRSVLLLLRCKRFTCGAGCYV
jgi:hypothetical protein